MRKVLFGCCFIFVFLTISGFSKNNHNISGPTSFKSAEEILYIAQKSYGIHAGVAESLALPTKIGQKVHIVVLYYREGMRPGEEIIYPPHHKITIDAATGKVVENRPVTPRDLGVSKDPGAATEGFGLDPAMTADAFWDFYDRFINISPAVWEIFKTGETQLSDQDLEVIKEYNAIFLCIAKTPFLPYYKAVASDFFDWLSRALSRVPDDAVVDCSSQDPTAGAPAQHLNNTGPQVGSAMATGCTEPPIVKRTNLTPGEKRRLILRVTADPGAVRGEFFLPMFLKKQDLPGNLEMTQDTRRHLPLDPDDDKFARHCGFSSGLALWESGFDQTIWRLVDIRYIFPTEKEAQAYHAEQLPVMSEGQPRIPGAPLAGTHCGVFGGHVTIKGTPLTHYYYIFSVQNVVVKLYVAQGPHIAGTKKALTLEMVAGLAETCIQRIQAYNRDARLGVKRPGIPD
jgi:hypothetical protein